jgi:hypothetical protein
MGVMADLSVEFDDRHEPPVGELRGRIGPLLRALIAATEGLQDVDQVWISPIPGAAAGRGRQATVLARLSSGPTKLPPLVLHIGPRSLIADERRRYEKFVRYLLSAPHASATAYAELNDDAVLSYSHLSDAEERALRTLGQQLTRHGTTPLVNAAIGALFSHNLAPTAHGRGLGSTTMPFDEQRALWFYNQVLPPTLVLGQARLVKPSAHTSKLPAVLATADRPASAGLPGSKVSLGRGKTIGHIEALQDERSGRWRLHLYAAPPPRAALHRPFEPLLARIELSDPLPEAALRGLIHGERALAGLIEQTRYGLLEGWVRERVLPHIGARGAAGITHRGRALADPLLVYADLLAQPMQLHTGVIHGDLNLNNILLGPGVVQQQTRAWLIDFDHADSGAHAVFDAVKLETEYKARILASRIRPDQQIDLELAMHQALVAPKVPELRAMLPSKELLAAYNLLASIRAPMIGSPTAIEPHEYYLGLLGYGLAALKYQNPSDEAAAAYLSASLAATQLRAAAETAAAEADPPRFFRAAAPFPRLDEAERLVGREDEVGRAVVCLAGTEQRMAVLYGPQGMQGYKVATEVCDRLDEIYDVRLSGAAAIADHAGAYGASSASIPGIGELLQLLRSEIPQLPELDAGDTDAGAMIATGNSLESLAARLGQALDGAPRPLLLVLRLEQAGGDLLRFVEQLWYNSRRTAFLLIAAQPFAVRRLPSEHQIRLPRWGQHEVRIALERARLPADAQLVEHLRSASDGIPEVVELVIDPVRSLQGMDVSELRRRLLEQRPTSLQSYAAGIVQGWSVSRVRAAGLEGCVRTTYGRSASHALEILRQQGLLSPTPAPDMRISSESELAAEVQQRTIDEFLSYVDTPALLRQAIDRLQAFRTTPSVLAQWHAWAGDWERVSEILVGLVQRHESITFPECERLYQLALGAQQHRRRWQHVWLSGLCAAQLGLFETAIKAFEVLAQTAEQKVAVRCRAQLLSFYRERSDATELRKASARLARLVGPDSPYSALVAGYSADPSLETLQGAIAALDASEPQWDVAERRFLAGHRVLLLDRLSMLYRRGHKLDQAVAALIRAHNLAIETDEQALIGRICNNLGLIAFFDQAEPAAARGWLEDAKRTREAAGDLVGQLRTAQNLASITIELATNSEEWDKAESMLNEQFALARRVDAGDKELLFANLLDLLVRNGKQQLYSAYYQEGADTIPDPTTRRLMQINMARAALWENNAPRLAALLTSARALLGPEDTEDTSEWFQLRAEGVLRGLLPPFDSELLRQAEELQGAELPPPWSYDLAFTVGMVALAAARYSAAAVSLDASLEGWNELGYRFKSSLAGAWAAVAWQLGGDHARAQGRLRESEEKLQKFGPDIPALALIAFLRKKYF